MARSRTTFKPGHAMLPGAGFQPGNTLPVKHGAFSPAIVEARMAELDAQLEAELEGVPYWVRQDGGLIRDYKYLRTQIELLRDWLAANGGPLTTRGNLKVQAKQLNTLIRQAADQAKTLGLGAVPRSEAMKNFAGVGLAQAEVRAAEERLRERIRNRQELPRVIGSSE